MCFSNAVFYLVTLYLKQQQRHDINKERQNHKKLYIFFQHHHYIRLELRKIHTEGKHNKQEYKNNKNN